MGELGRFLRTIEGSRLAFWCVGCDEAHVVFVGSGGWVWNGNIERPTLSPSVLVRSGHFVPGHKSSGCWCTYNREHSDNPAPFVCSVCHLFITDGRIQYLSDCTHAFAGQTIDLPTYPHG